jgi:hypothetical protein
MSEREARNWASRRDVVSPERMLVHAWTWALQTYPPAALTVWLQRTTPATDPYSFYIDGDTLSGEHADRRLYDAVRARRRQPKVAESFFGRIEGRASNGTSQQVATGIIDLPPEPETRASTWSDPQNGAPPWGAPPGYAGAPPWGYPPPYGMAPPWGGPSGYMGGPPSPYGMPPPWAWGPPGFAGAPPAQPAAAPAAIAQDPALLELWRSIQTIQATSAQHSADAQMRSAEIQGKLLMQLLERATPAAASSGGGNSSMKDAFEMLATTMRLAKEMTGGGGEEKGHRGLHIHQVGSDLLVEDKNGEIDPVATSLLGLKDGVKEIVKGVAARRAAIVGARNGAAPVGGSAGASALPKKIAAPPPPGANGEGNGGAP